MLNRLLEELVPFMDRGIHDPQPLHKRRSMPSRAKPQAVCSMCMPQYQAAARAPLRQLGNFMTYPSLRMIVIT